MLQAGESPNGAKRKGRLGVKRPCLVCSGGVALKDARDAIWTDWKVAYAAYGRMVCHRACGLKSGDCDDD